MGKTLDIIVTHYKEPWDVGKKLFDSIAIQECVNFDDICVIIVNDGEENELPEWHFVDYPYQIDQLNGILKKYDQGGMLIGESDNYMRLFVVEGGLAIVFGLLAFLFMKDAPTLTPNRQGSFSRQLFSGFDFKALLKRRELLWVFLVLCVYFIGFNVYYPHVGNYMIYYLGFSPDDIGIIQGIALLLGMVSVIPASMLLNRNKFAPAAALAVLLSLVGVGMLGIFGRPENVDPNTILNWTLLIGLFFFGCGYIMFMQVTSVWMKQLFPQEAKGQFEGFRIIFFVLIPWVVSPFIANPIIKRNGEILDQNGLPAYLPTHVLFLISTVLILLTFVPLVFAARHRRQRLEAAPESL